MSTKDKFYVNENISLIDIAPTGILMADTSTKPYLADRRFASRTDTEFNRQFLTYI